MARPGVKTLDFPYYRGMQAGRPGSGWLTRAVGPVGGIHDQRVEPVIPEIKRFGMLEGLPQASCRCANAQSDASAVSVKSAADLSAFQSNAP
jgi:hypothetical protein